jgi:hypothetical protein
MSCILELPQLPEDDGVSQREVGATGIHAELHAKRSAGREPLLETALRNEVDAAAGERRQHVGGHGAAMLPHLPDPPQDAGYTRPR